MCGRAYRAAEQIACPMIRVVMVKWPNGLSHYHLMAYDTIVRGTLTVWNMASNKICVSSEDSISRVLWENVKSKIGYYLKSMVGICTGSTLTEVRWAKEDHLMHDPIKWDKCSVCIQGVYNLSLQHQIFVACAFIKILNVCKPENLKIYFLWVFQRIIF